MFLPRQIIVFKFTENTCLNRMQILHLISTELGKLKYSKNYLVNKIYVTAAGLEHATI